jgi:probable HAF family extracellular repeat protein
MSKPRRKSGGHALRDSFETSGEILPEASRMFLLLKSFGLIYALCVAPVALAQVRYHITRIPTAQGANSVALGINNAGEAVGYSFRGEDYQAFLYSSSPQSLTLVGSLGGKINAACAINDAGQVTGYSQDADGNLLAFIYSRTQPIASLGTLDDAPTSEAFGINSGGTAVGDSQSGTQNHRPVMFFKGSVRDLGIGGSNETDALETAYAINDAGQIVGRYWSDKNAFHAFVSLNGNPTDLGTLGGANAEALAINKNGQIVGDSDTTEGTAHAFVFDNSKLKDLGTLPGFENASYARGINSAGEIVGESDSADQKRAFLYTKGQLVELDKLAEDLSEAGFTSLDVAYGISDKGRIVGYGTTTDHLTAAFVAVPENHRQRRMSGPRAPQQEQAEAERTQPESQPGQWNEGNYDLFYSELASDEGNWVEAGNYGYCFRPNVSEDWKPYEDGHWVWTDRGWYWDSNERFAWATYHYGRWVDIGGTGWCWTPGNQWAPAWVSWRQSDENVGWAPLPPEADGSGSISSWSDSYYDIGPAAYNFISYSHWNQPSYAQYIEPSQRNIQIISQTRNVTNIVTNNNVINNFGPPVQTIAAKTNQNIQQVKLAITPATDPKANYGQTLQGNQLKVVAPPVTLSARATHLPPVQNRIANPQIEKGWQGVTPQDAEKLRKTIAEQNPLPKDLPKPTPFVNTQIGNKGQITRPSGAPGSPAAVAGQKTPPNLLKPSVRSPNANVTPGASPNTAAPGKKSFPPNLLGTKASESASPIVKPPVAPGGPPKPGEKPIATSSPVPKQAPSGNVSTQMAPKGTPPNLLAPRPSTTAAPPESQRHQAAGGPTPKATDNLPSGETATQAPLTPHNAETPIADKKPTTAPSPLPQAGPATVATPESSRKVKPAQRGTSGPKPSAVSESHSEPVATPKPAPEVKVKQQIKTESPHVQHTPAPQPQARHIPPAEPQPPKTGPIKREAKMPPPQVQHPAQPQIRRAPAVEPQVHRSAPPPKPAPPSPKPAPPTPKPAPPAPRPASPQGGQKPAPAKGKPTPSP